MEKKYELIGDKNAFGLRRIRALRDFGDVRKGDIGGFVKSEDNLFHGGNCWIYDNARVSGNATVHDNARVMNNAGIYHNADIAGNAKVSQDAMICDSALVFDYARVFGNAQVIQEAIICDYSEVYEHAKISESAHIAGFARVFGNAQVSGCSYIFEYAQVFGESQISDSSRVSGNARIFGNAALKNHDEIISGSINTSVDGFASKVDSRGYTFMMSWKDGKIVYISAGCRAWKSLKEARNHFLINYDSDGDVKECLAILKFLENKISGNKWKRFLTFLFGGSKVRL